MDTTIEVEEKLTTDLKGGYVHQMSNGDVAYKTRTLEEFNTYYDKLTDEMEAFADELTLIENKCPDCGDNLYTDRRPITREAKCIACDKKFKLTMLVSYEVGEEL